MEGLSRLSGFLLSHAARTLAGGAQLSPTLALEGDGGRELQRFTDEDLQRAVRDARDALRQKLLTAHRAALLLMEEGADGPHLVVEGAELGEPVRELRVTVPFQRAGGRLTLEGPRFDFPSTLRLEAQKGCLDAFQAGLAEDTAGQEAWAAALHR